jgi:hypothetical protein
MKKKIVAHFAEKYHKCPVQYCSYSFLSFVESMFGGNGISGLPRLLLDHLNFVHKHL